MSCATFGADSIGSKVRYARAEQRGMPVPKSTLHRWATDIYATRYVQLRAQLLPQIEERIATNAEELFDRQAELEAEIVEKLWDSLNDLKPAELANALRNVGVSKAINLDKAQLMRGKPTEIVERRDADQLIRTLQAAGVIHVDSDAEEIEEAQDDALPPAA